MLSATFNLESIWTMWVSFCLSGYYLVGCVATRVKESSHHVRLAEHRSISFSIQILRSSVCVCCAWVAVSRNAQPNRAKSVRLKNRLIKHGVCFFMIYAMFCNPYLKIRNIAGRNESVGEICRCQTRWGSRQRAGTRDNITLISCADVVYQFSVSPSLPIHSLFQFF